MCFCICNGGIQRTAATRYLDYLDYLDYLVHLEYLECLDYLEYLECLDYLEHLGFIYLTKFQQMVLAGWLPQCESTIIYERRLRSQVLYVILITSILGRLALVPMGETGTILYSMCKEASTFPGAACDSKPNGADGNRWWYVNSLP